MALASALWHVVVDRPRADGVGAGGAHGTHEAIAESGERVGVVTRVARQLVIGPESLGKEVPHAHLHNLPVELCLPPQSLADDALCAVRDWPDVRDFRDPTCGYTLW